MGQGQIECLLQDTVDERREEETSKDTGKVGDFVYIAEALDISLKEVGHRNCI